MTPVDKDQQTNLDRKRIRVILSGDEDERHDEVDCSREGSIDSQRRMLLLLMDSIVLCPIPTRTVQKIADALEAGSVLAKLSIGYVNPISGNAIVNLLLKLAIWKRFISTQQNIVKYFSSIYLYSFYKCDPASE
ncbi:hypothetical protein NC651_012712 [Populus alba x Populus x berolinensis]|nr:hypothetical protein NC651_012712 [Populus alba x Populus x berolinensis]